MAPDMDDSTVIFQSRCRLQKSKSNGVTTSSVQPVRKSIAFEQRSVLYSVLCTSATALQIASLKGTWQRFLLFRRNFSLGKFS
jgi:hypothetical protein